ncbi:MAG: NAD(P)/FAD-dependent oxidoreductase, partial [Bacilli bacterium]
ELLELLSDMGFAYYFDNEGRAYPFANTSESLWNTLVNSLKKVGVNILLNSEVRNIFPDKKTIKVNDKEQEYDTLFIGVGGAAYDRGLNTFKNIFESMNINYIDQSPALCPVTIQQKIPRFLSGTRLKGNLTLYKDDTPFYDEQGELLFKKDGISGICVFNSSLFINDDSKYTIKFNPFIHDKCMTSLDGKKPLEYLHGFFPSRLIEYFATLGYKKMDDEDVLNSLQFTVKGKYPLKNSQISLGGINPNEIETNLSLSKYPNIFVGGEIVDLHGICGGYNIGSALLMGFKAADSVD